MTVTPAEIEARKAFEAWWDRNPPPRGDNPAHHAAWRAWQAALRTQDAELVALLAYVRDEVDWETSQQDMETLARIDRALAGLGGGA